MTAEPSGNPNERLSETLSSFARLLVTDYDVGDVLYQLCVAAVDITGTTGAGILLEDVDGRLRYAVASDSLTGELEAIQLELGEGPCMLAHSTGAPVLIPDLLAATERFPGMVPRTVDKGMRAVFTMPLLRDERSIGILDLYRDEPGDMSPWQLDAGSLLADMSSTAVLNRRSYDTSVEVTQRLQSALDSRILMEQAKGRVSYQVGVEMTRAEELIYEFARALQRPIGAVVREIAAGQLVLPSDGGVAARRSARA